MPIIDSQELKKNLKNEKVEVGITIGEGQTDLQCVMNYLGLSQNLVNGDGVEKEV